MPDWKHELGRRLTGLNLPASREAEILDEVAQHLDDRYAELRRGGADDATPGAWRWTSLPRPTSCASSSGACARRGRA
jgi:hypothetical protein